MLTLEDLSSAMRPVRPVFLILLLTAARPAFAADALVVTTLPFQDRAAQDAIFRLLSDELSRALGERVVFEAGKSYEDVIGRLTARQTDVAFLGGVAYLEARRRGNARAILRTVRAGRGSYRGVIIVASGSTVRDLAALKGAKAVGFVDRLSTTGFVFPAQLLRDAGVTLEDKQRFVGSHQAVVAAVTDRRLDAGAVFEGAVDMLSDPGAVRVLATTEDVPGDPVVVRPGLGKQRVAALRSAFMELATKPEARPFFEHAGIDSLVPVTDSDYDPFAKRVRQLRRRSNAR